MMSIVADRELELSEATMKGCLRIPTVGKTEKLTSV
jgi:hypothetical protein